MNTEEKKEHKKKSPDYYKKYYRENPERYVNIKNNTIQKNKQLALEKKLKNINKCTELVTGLKEKGSIKPYDKILNKLSTYNIEKCNRQETLEIKFLLELLD